MSTTHIFPDNVVKLKHSYEPGKKPKTTDIGMGEIALNISDGIIFYKDKNGVIREFNNISINNHHYHNHHMHERKPKSILSKVVETWFLVLSFVIMIIIAMCVKILMKILNL